MTMANCDGCPVAAMAGVTCHAIRRNSPHDCRLAATFPAHADQVRQRSIAEPPVRSPTIIRPAAPPQLPVVRATSVLITAGIGDWFVIDSHLTDHDRSTLREVHYATRQRQTIAALIDASPAYQVKRHIPTWDDFEEIFSFSSAMHLLFSTMACPPQGTVDWSIAEVFRRIDARELRYTGSSYLRGGPIADVARLDLPSLYWAIHPSSSNDRRRPRDFGPDDWAAAIDHLERRGSVGVVLGTGDDPVPDHPRLVDRTNQTTFPEAIQVLRRACGFVGCASSFSVLAAQLFRPSQLAIQGTGTHLDQWKHCYYAPHKRFDFVGPSVRPLLVPAAIQARRSCGCPSGGGA